MESVILELTKQLLSLTTENATLKIELAKFQNAPVLLSDLPQPKKISKKQQYSLDQVLEQVPPKPKHPGHVAAGKKLAVWNATRKKNLNELLDQAKVEGEW